MLNIESVLAAGNSTQIMAEGKILSLDASIVWTFVNLILLVILLRIFLFKPVNKMMDERTKKIQDDLNAAQKAKEDAENIKKQYDDTLKTAKDEAHAIVAGAVDKAEEERKAIVAKAENEAQEVFRNNAKNIEDERKRSVQEAQAEIADLAIAAASKILGESVDDDANRKLVDNFLEQEGADK